MASGVMAAWVSVVCTAQVAAAALAAEPAAAKTAVAGDEAYILKVRVSSPQALEALLAEIRAAAGVSTRTTVVLSTPFEERLPQ